jgi:ammonia channel protein AmtB
LNFFLFRKIDDVCDVVALHFVNGIWGHLAVCLFADPSSGPKSLFIDGSVFRLKVQFISCVCLIIFSVIMFYIILKIVDHFIGIRLSEEAEIMGSDEYEHCIEPSKPLLLPTEIKLDSLSQPDGLVTDQFQWKRNQYHVNQGFQQ